MKTQPPARPSSWSAPTPPAIRFGRDQQPAHRRHAVPGDRRRGRRAADHRGQHAGDQRGKPGDLCARGRRGRHRRATASASIVTDGTLSSPAAKVTINVLAVNQPPSFAVGPNQSVFAGAGPQTVAGWATQISSGESNGSNPVLTFHRHSDRWSDGPVQRGPVDRLDGNAELHAFGRDRTATRSRWS